MRKLRSLPGGPQVATPTPLQPAPRPSVALGVEVWSTQDDHDALAAPGPARSPGARWLRSPYEIIGVPIGRPVDECVARISSLGEGVGELPSLARTDAGDPVEFGGYLGPGYGQPSPEGEAEVRLVARTEGVFLLTGGTPTFFSRGRASL